MSIGLLGFSSQGGAGRVLVNLEEGLNSIGHNAQSYFASEQDIRSEPFRNPQLTLAAGIDNYLIKKSGWKSNVSFLRSRISETLPTWLHDKENLIVGWSTGLFGFSTDLFKDKRVIWTLPDFISFTGFCHYNLGCRGFETGCQSCPAAKGIFGHAVSKNLDEKIEFFKGIENLTFVAHSDFTFDNFMKSKLGSNFEIVNLPTPIDSYFFSEQADQVRNQERKLKLLMVIGNLEDPIKGFENVANDLHEFASKADVSATVVGKGSANLEAHYPNFRFTGPLGNSDLFVEYGIADILIVPSIVETAGMIILEAASRGTPAIVRAGSGMTEMIGNGESGWVFNSWSELLSILENNLEEELFAKSRKAKAMAKKLEPSTLAKEYAMLLQKT